MTAANYDIPLLQNYESPKRKRNLCDDMRPLIVIALRIAICILIAVSVILLLIMFARWAVPNHDDGSNPHLSNFRVNAISIPSFNPNSTSAVNWKVDFVVQNPIAHITCYDPLTVRVYGYKGFLGETTSNPFVRNVYTTTMTVQFATPGTILNQVYNSSNGGGRHLVYLNIYVYTDLRFIYGSGDLRIRFFCKNVMVVYPEGTLYGGPKNCMFNIY